MSGADAHVDFGIPLNLDADSSPLAAERITAFSDGPRLNMTARRAASMVLAVGPRLPRRRALVRARSIPCMRGGGRKDQDGGGKSAVEHASPSWC